MNKISFMKDKAISAYWLWWLCTTSSMSGIPVLGIHNTGHCIQVLLPGFPEVYGWPPWEQNTRLVGPLSDPAGLFLGLTCFYLNQDINTSPQTNFLQCTQVSSMASLCSEIILLVLGVATQISLCLFEVACGAWMVHWVEKSGEWIWCRLSNMGSVSVRFFHL